MDNTNPEAVQAASPVAPPPREGVFLSSLVRTNSQIKAGRAESIADSTKIVYRRRVEDIAAKAKKLRRTLSDSLDLSGDSALSLKVAANFDENDWVQNDINSRMELRNVIIQLAVTYAGYVELFGDAPNLLDGIEVDHVQIF